MDPVSNLSRIIELLRRRALDTAAKTGQRDKSAGAGGSERVGTPRSVQDLQFQIVERIRRLDPRSDSHKQQATRIFVESVLAWEFGDKVMNDPRFFVLVDHVQAAMESDAAIDATMKNMVEEMSS